MKPFIDEHFLLETKTAQKLYHDHAKSQPIIDFHNHLPPDEIASDRKYKNITEVWLGGDHYKWRAMRALGVDEKYCTGDAEDFQKFQKWAECLPQTIRNPLHHWAQMELKNYFGITELLNGKNARKIFDACNEQLQDDNFSARNLLKRSNVETVCTTDDPADPLDHHQKIMDEKISIKVLPTFRPDKAMAVENPETYNAYLGKLEATSGMAITSYSDLLDALKKRHDTFGEMGGKLSDHGLETVYAEDFTEKEVKKAFQKVREGKQLGDDEILKVKSALLYELAILDYEKGWTQQFHVGAKRNNSTRMYEHLGADSGFDSMGEFNMADPLSKFFDRLDYNKQLARTIVYNLNPKDNHTIATMVGNYNDGSTWGKMQFGTAWWFNDQIDGMTKQIDALSYTGILSTFIGMLTDSRSFLSFPRHEYFRRLLCKILGNDVEKGLIPDDDELVGGMVENICYHNAKNYFKF